MRNFYGIGNHLAPRLIAEIGYVRRRGMYLSDYASEFLQMIQMLLS